VSGVFGSMAESLANARQAAARADGAAIMWGALGSGLALAVTAALALASFRDRLTPRLFALTLALVVGCDLWLNARGFWIYAPDPREDWFRPDPVTSRLNATKLPYRVLDLGVYGADALMAFDIPQVLGYHGNELRYYDELLGGKNQWDNLRYVHLWDLLAVRYAIAPWGGRNADSIPGYTRLLDSVPTSAGTRANLFERTDPQPYVRVVPGAIKADSDAIIPTLLDQRMDYSRLVLFTNDQPIAPEPIKAMPEPSPSRASVTTWQPGHITVSLDPAPPTPSYVLVAENWFPNWQASVDGRPTASLRGNFSLITVPVPAGARTVELTFRSRDYETGRTVSLASLFVLAVVAAAPLVRRRRGSA